MKIIILSPDPKIDPIILQCPRLVSVNPDLYIYKDHIFLEGDEALAQILCQVIYRNDLALRDGMPTGKAAIVPEYIKRWPEAEKYIMQHTASAFWYAKYCIRDRWPEAEPIIMQDGIAAEWYSTDILHRRWPEAEKAIRAYPLIWEDYKKRWDI